MSYPGLEPQVIGTRLSLNWSPNGVTIEDLESGSVVRIRPTTEELHRLMLYLVWAWNLDGDKPSDVMLHFTKRKPT
jgi:hypothetical protein